MPLWVVFFGLFIAFARYKGEIVDLLNQGNTMARMYYNVKLVEDGLFTTLCPNRIRIQDCSVDEKEAIFRGTVPPDYLPSIAGWMERSFNCNGYRSTHIDKFCFSDVNR